MPIDEQPLEPIKIDESPFLPGIVTPNATQLGQKRSELTQTPSPYIPKWAPAVTGAVGEVLGGPIAGGTLAGLTELARDPNQSGSALLTGLLQSVPLPLSSSLKKGLMKGTLRGIGATPAGQLPEDLAATAAYPELKQTVGQATGSQFPQFLEGTLGRSAKLGRELEQQQTLVPNLLEKTRQKIVGSTIPSGAETSVEKAAPIRLNESQAFDRVRQFADQNTQTFKIKTGEIPSNVLGPNKLPIMIPQYVDKNVAGPINIQNAASFASQLKPEIDTLYANLPTMDKGVIGQLKSAVDKLVNPEVVTDAGERIVPFDTVKQLRSDIGELANNKMLRDMYQSRQTGGLNKLRQLLGDDLSDSISQWPNGAGQSLNALQSANAITKQRVKANAFDRLVYESSDPASKGFNPDTFINKMKDESDWYRGTFSAKDRADIEGVMRAIRTVQPTPQSGYFAKSLGIHAGMFTLGAATGLLTGHSIMGDISGLGLMVGAHQFASKVLLDPKYARLAARLPSLPIDSFEASTITKTLLKAMKGEAVYLTTPDGGKIQATIDEKGIPRPNFQMGAQQ